jgi:ferredoxin
MVLVLWLVGERGHAILPSSRVMLAQCGWRRLVNGSALHGYVYGRWTNQYLRVLFYRIVPRLGARGKKWLTDRYHGKVLTHDQATAIVTINRDIPRLDLEQVIPYPMARKLVLEASPDVAAYECACRHARTNPCQPSQVCLVIGQPFVDFILEHHPSSSRRLTQAEAVNLLREEHERGHVHAAWFKDALFDRFYTICNCCTCCCNGIEAMLKYGLPCVAPSGYVAHVDETVCAGCGTCEATCAFGAAKVHGKSEVNWEACMGCGACEGKCPSGAISLMPDARKGIPFDVRALADRSGANAS